MRNRFVFVAVGLRVHRNEQLGNIWGTFRGTVKEQVCLRSEYLGLREHDREHLGEQQLRLPRRGSRSGLLRFVLFSCAETLFCW